MMKNLEDVFNVNSLDLTPQPNYAKISEMREDADPAARLTPEPAAIGAFRKRLEQLQFTNAKGEELDLIQALADLVLDDITDEDIIAKLRESKE